MKLVICYMILLVFPAFVIAQKTTITDSTEQGFRTVIAGKHYERSGLHNFLWGKHYRKEWTTPVKVPVINLDTEAGGRVKTGGDAIF